MKYLSSVIINDNNSFFLSLGPYIVETKEYDKYYRLPNKKPLKNSLEKN